MNVHSRWILVAMWLCAIVTGAQTVAAAEGRPFEVKVAGAENGERTYGNPIVLTVTVEPTEDVEVSDLSLVPRGDLEEFYGSPPAKEDEEGEDTTCKFQGDPEAVTPGAPSVWACRLVAIEGYSWWRPMTWLLAPGRQQVSVRIAIAVTVKGELSPLEFFEDVPIDFRAPNIAIFLGGLAGALLLALFTAIRERINAPQPSASIQPALVGAERKFGGWLHTLMPRAWKMLLQTLMGGICAIILILLAQTTEGLNLPISIKVKDFVGGVVTGLFSVPLSLWIWDRVNPAPPSLPSPPMPTPEGTP